MIGAGLNPDQLHRAGLHSRGVGSYNHLRLEEWKMFSRILGFGFILVVLAALGGAPLAAQDGGDCGTSCKSCGPEAYEGYDHDDHGGVDMTCYQNVPNCVICSGPQLVADGEPATAGVLEALNAASNEELTTLANTYHDRLLLSASRNLVVLQGNGCDAGALTSVLFVNPEKYRQLKALGLRSLERHLAIATPDVN